MSQADVPLYLQEPSPIQDLLSKLTKEIFVQVHFP
jgi:hypothetical protein